MEMQQHWFCLGMICLLSASMHYAAPVYDENDVIKDREHPNIPNHHLEAYYYRIYADLESSDHPVFDRQGKAGTTSTCQDIRPVPELLRLNMHMRPFGIHHYYEKYTEAYGIPVLGASHVSDRALQRACYVLRFLLSDREDIRQKFYKAYGRIAVIGKNDKITSIPEYHFLPEMYNEKTRGLGGIPIAPVSTAGEENVVCYANDTNRYEDILLREIAEGILNLAVRYIRSDFMEELESIYHRAMASGWWANTYAAHTPESYFGEGVQSYFNTNGYSYPPDGVHNEVNIRTKLQSYDPSLYVLIQSVFPCANYYLKRCNGRDNESYQRLRMDCTVGEWIENR